MTLFGTATHVEGSADPAGILSGWTLVAISGGILVFHDSVGTGPAEIIGRTLAFCLVIGGAGLIPAPVRSDSGQTTSCPARAGADLRSRRPADAQRGWPSRHGLRLIGLP
jgi:hypothetical protein